MAHNDMYTPNLSSTTPYLNCIWTSGDVSSPIMRVRIRPGARTPAMKFSPDAVWKRVNSTWLRVNSGRQGEPLNRVCRQD